RRLVMALELEAQALGDLARGRGAVDDDHVAVPAEGVAALGIELVVDLADDLLDDVLERDEPDDRAVLVVDEADVAAVAAHVAEDAVDAGGLGDVGDRAGDLAKVDLPF